jgi:hypothetical protein
VNNPAMADVNALIAHQDAEGAVDLRHEVCDDSFLPLQGRAGRQDGF